MFNINDQPVSVIHIKKTFEVQPHLQFYMILNIQYIETDVFVIPILSFFIFVSDYPESCPTKTESEKCTLD